MFTHYLTYSFALNFQREIFLLPTLPEPTRTNLHESVDRMVRQLADAVKPEADLETKAKALLVSVLCLRDCREILASRGPLPDTLAGPYEVLHGRLERICAEAHDALERLRRTGRLAPSRTGRGTA